MDVASARARAGARPRIFARVGVLVGALLLATPAAPALLAAQDAAAPPEPRVEITFLDVGQADAVVIRGPDGLSAMIDAGRSSPLRYLQRMGIDSLALLVASGRTPK